MDEKAPSEAKIIPFSEKVRQLDALSDNDVIRHYLSELRHPGVRFRLAEYILDTTEPSTGKNLSQERAAWHDRLHDIINGKSHDEPDDIVAAEFGRVLVETESDEVVMLIDALSHDTVSRAEELKDERRALRRLRSLRESAARRGMYDEDTERWKDIIESLMSRGKSNTSNA